MTPEDFAALAAQDYNRIPVSIEVLADLETPISAYRKVAEGPYSYFFESVQGGEKWGRYSIIGLPCRTLLKVYDHRAETWVNCRYSMADWWAILATIPCAMLNPACRPVRRQTVWARRTSC